MTPLSLVVCTDHDGVMADTDQMVVDEINKLFRTNYKIGDINVWDWVYRCALSHGLSEKEALELEENIWFTPKYLSKAKPTYGACRLTRWFCKNEIPFYIVSSRRPLLKESTLKWYQKWMPWIKKELILMRSDEKMSGDMFKARVVSELGATYFLEDRVEHAKTILEKTETTVILFSHLGKLDKFGKSRLVRIDGEKDKRINIWSFSKLILHS